MRRFYAAAAASLFGITLGVAPQATAATLNLKPEVLTVGANASMVHTGKQHTAKQDSGKASLRVATVSAGLSEEREGALAERLEGGNDTAAQMLARSVQQTRPDVLLVTDIDTDSHVADIFNEQYLGQAQTDGAEANADAGADAGSKELSSIEYKYVYSATTNAGVQAGADLNGNGTTGDPGDAFGAGDFEGQRSMVLYSRYPIDQDEVRTFNDLTWDDVPGNSLDTEKYSKLVRSVLPLNSTSMWDIPLKVDGETLHVIATDLTPDNGEGADPVRRLDQLRFLSMYLNDNAKLRELTDDAGQYGGLDKSSSAVVLGALGPDEASLGSDADQMRQDASAELETLMDSKSLEVAKPSMAAGQCENTLPIQIRTFMDFMCATQYATRMDGVASRSDYVGVTAGPKIVESGIETAMSDAGDHHEHGSTDHLSGERRMVWADITLKRD